MNQAISAVVLWSGEAVRPTIERLRSLVRLERAMARKVLQLPRGRDEDVWTWRARHARTLEAIYRRLGLKTWACQSLAAYWKWAGHMYRRQGNIAETTDYRSALWKQAVRE
eukprot:4411709-Alexandrium_andersonii.AAC.1